MRLRSSPVYCYKCGAQTLNWRQCDTCRKSTPFHQQDEWLELKEHVLDYYGRRCMACGSTDHPQVDHIKPRSKHPDLALWFANLQVLCQPCNFKKGTRTEQDWRPRKLLI